MMPRATAKATDLDKIFSPFSPVTRKEQFYGREKELNTIRTAIISHGRHIMMYGERGVGKTSISNMILNGKKDFWVYKLTLHHKSSLHKVWKTVLQQVKEYLLTSKIHQKKNLINKIEAMLTKASLSNEDIVSLLSSLKKKILIVLDEFDVLDKSITSEFAYLIKNFSDNADNVTFFLIGIANTIEDLIGNHHSIERCLLQVRVPRMDDAELSDLIDNGLRKANLFIDPSVKKDIINFSKGLPYYVQLITKCAANSAIHMKYNTIVQINLKEAIKEAIRQTHESAAMTYEVASSSRKNNNHTYETIVKACALVKEDERGMFRLADVTSLMGRRKSNDKKQKNDKVDYHVRQLCLESRGKLLQKIHYGQNTLYRFNNPIVKAYILLKLHQDGEAIRLPW